jgi:hypothetical protein
METRERRNEFASSEYRDVELQEVSGRKEEGPVRKEGDLPHYSIMSTLPSKILPKKNRPQ